MLGSSPLARGTPAPTPVWYVCSRLIPARAGNTSSLNGACALPTAHPRSRGEHSLRENHAAIVPGSSPLARGTPGVVHLFA